MVRLPTAAMSPHARLRLTCALVSAYSTRTWGQSHSSSSATSCAAEVMLPCPISERAQRRSRGRDLLGLAVAARRHLVLDPGLMHGVKPAARREALQGLDAFARRRGNGKGARAHRLAVHMHRARPALRDAAAELGALHVELVAQHPEQRHVGLDVDLARTPVDGQLDHFLSPWWIVIL